MQAKTAHEDDHSNCIVNYGGPKWYPAFKDGDKFYTPNGIRILSVKEFRLNAVEEQRREAQHQEGQKSNGEAPVGQGSEQGT